MRSYGVVGNDQIGGDRRSLAHPGVEVSGADARRSMMIFDFAMWRYALRDTLCCKKFSAYFNMGKVRMARLRFKMAPPVLARANQDPLCIFPKNASVASKPLKNANTAGPRNDARRNDVARVERRTRDGRDGPCSRPSPRGEGREQEPSRGPAAEQSSCAGGSCLHWWGLSRLESNTMISWSCDAGTTDFVRACACAMPTDFVELMCSRRKGPSSCRASGARTP